MFGKNLVNSPFVVLDSLFQFVVGAFHVLPEGYDFAQLGDAINGSLTAEPTVRATRVVVKLPLINSLVDLVLGRCVMEPEFIQVGELCTLNLAIEVRRARRDRSKFDAFAHQTSLH